MSSIYDIAKYTGFSPSTVARVLGGTGYASAKARKSIAEAAQKLGYAPSYAAKVMRTKRTNRILFCVPQLNEQFYFRINQKICPAMDEAGFFCLTSVTENSEEKELRMVNALREDIADGMIMISQNVTPKLTDILNTLEKPVVLINWAPNKQPHDRFHNVYTDVTDGVFKTTKLLIDHGHREIALVVFDAGVTTTQSRYLGYQKALEQHNIPLREELVFQTIHYADCSAVCENILALPTRPTGVVFCSDAQAVQFIVACRRHNLEVPRDISVIGMNNDDIAGLSDPPLSTFFLKDSQLGETAARLLLDSLEGRVKGFQSIRLEGELIYRNSVAVRRG